jgi:hypothetical protein
MADQKQRQQRYPETRQQSKEQRAPEGQKKRPKQYFFLPVFFHQQPRWNGHDPVGHKKRKGHKARQSQAQIEAIYDIRDDGPQYIAEKRNDEKDEKNKDYQECIALHET